MRLYAADVQQADIVTPYDSLKPLLNHVNKARGNQSKIGKHKWAENPQDSKNADIPAL